MRRLPPQTYLDHLREESTRFRDVLASCDPAARVPSCPDWDAADLLWHLATVQRWWTEVLEARPVRPEEIYPARPDDYAPLLATFDEWTDALARALESCAPEEEAWNWSSDHTVGFILRRQTHEALIHRVDAELAAGVPLSEVDPVLAADGVHEALDVMYGGCPEWGTWEPLPDLVRVDMVDVGTSLWIQLGLFSGTDPDDGTAYTDEEDVHVITPPDTEVEPDVVLDGTAAALDLWLWGRGDDADLSTAGDSETLSRFRTIVASPIN